MIPDPAKHLEFHQKQEPITDELLSLLRKIIPQSWKRARYVAEVTSPPASSNVTIKLRLFNPLTFREIMTFPDRLCFLTAELHRVFAEYQRSWTKCTVKFPALTGKDQRCELNFEYGPPGPDYSAN